MLSKDRIALFLAYNRSKQNNIVRKFLFQLHKSEMRGASFYNI